MKFLAVIFRGVFVSFEFLIVLVGIAIYFFFPTHLIWLSERIGKQSELLMGLAFVPAGLVAYDAALIKGILLPEEDGRKILQTWPSYWKIKWVVVIGFCYAIFFTILGVVTLVLGWDTPAAYQSALLLISVTGASCVTASLFFTQLKIEEIFREKLDVRGESD